MLLQFIKAVSHAHMNQRGIVTLKYNLVSLSLSISFLANASFGFTYVDICICVHFVLIRLFDHELSKNNFIMKSTTFSSFL